MEQQIAAIDNTIETLERTKKRIQRDIDALDKGDHRNYPKYANARSVLVADLKLLNERLDAGTV